MIGLEQMTPAGQENTEPVVMPDDEVLYELADLFASAGMAKPFTMHWMMTM